MSGFDFDAFLKSAVRTGDQITKAAIEEGKRAKERLSLKRAVDKELKKVNEMYRKIGKSYYEKYKSDTMDEYADTMEAITDSLGVVDDYMKKIRELSE
ncbi:MAG: hypothetical protein K6E13_00555 [Lachnospiraceae bacterium]|nr:hypothetical protein [Lachnospiraceae bacterium]